MAEKTRLVTPEGILMWAHLFRAKAQKKGGDKFQCDVVFSPEAMQTPEFAALKAEAQKVAIERFGERLKGLIAAEKFISPFWPNSRKINAETGKLPEGYPEGGCFITIKSDYRPGVGKLTPQGIVAVIDENDVYPGCIVRASVHAWSYDNESKGVSFGLNSILKVRDGKSLAGNAGDVTQDFAAFAGAAPQVPAEDIFGVGGLT